MTEETILKHQVKDYLAFKGIFNWHILQGMGCFRGAPDRIMHYRGRVVYLEIKKKKGILSENQKVFQAICKNDGIDYLVIKKLEDLIDYIDFLI